MKRIKKIASLLLAMVMVFAMSVTAFANGEVESGADKDTVPAGKGNYTITIDDSTPGYTYAAYQIFSADLDVTDEALSNIQWGSAIDLDKAEKVFEGKSAKDVAKALADATSTDKDDPEVAQQYARKFAECLKENAPSVESKVAGSGYEITDLTAGYYMVMNTENGVPTDGSATRYILEVSKDETVKPKRDVLIKDKDIIDDVEGAVKVNEAPIGKVENFRVWAKLPSNYDKYDDYYLTFNDNLTKGFTFNNDVKVYVATNTGTEEQVNFDLATATEVTSRFYVASKDAVYNNKDVTAITVGIQNLKWIEEAGIGEGQGNYIVVTYSATVNEQAVVGIVGNPNYVNVEYSNDPNSVGDGKEEPDEPQEPKPNHPTGVTPDSETTTYTTELTITKVDGANQSILPGAGFTLTGTGVQVSLVAEEEFVEATEGIYWKLKDGTYTTTAPTIAEDETDNSEDYADVTKKYKRQVTIAEANEKTDYAIQGIVGEDGTVTFTGLAVGDYTLTETVTPSGYNTIDPIKFSISFDRETKLFTSNSEDIKLGTNANNTFETTIENNKGSLLPSTGGIGTTIFYVVGGILVIGAGILLVTKRRMKAQ